MEDFIFYNPTKIIFGKGTHKLVSREIKPYGNRVLFVYGKGSIKETGLYSEIVDQLKIQDIEFFELSGVKSNPELGLVREGIEICRREKLGFILAVGGGSVIDTAKAIAIGVSYSGDVWDFFIGKKAPTTSLPVGIVLTIPGSGSEASDASVITHEKSKVKKSVHSLVMRPKFSILNPELTYTLKPIQLFYGISDTIAHVFERYFTPTKYVDLTDRLCEATIKSVMVNALLIKSNPDDYHPRAEIMWASTMAHNDILSAGRVGDWGCHKISHAISAIYDTPHGVTFSVIFPAWMKYVYRHDVARFRQFALRVFDVEPNFGSDESIIQEGIARLEKFYESLGLPLTLKDIGVFEDKFEAIAEKSVEFGAGRFFELQKEDVLEILKLANC
ncbi:MAG: iron-containing alcohol dehydrogenase [Actinobacteria bacterium]|nr:iron-containing alcohol dehydrogenase [Actinomycetota bacterium]